MVQAPTGVLVLCGRSRWAVALSDVVPSVGRKAVVVGRLQELHHVLDELPEAPYRFQHEEAGVAAGRGSSGE